MPGYDQHIISDLKMRFPGMAQYSMFLVEGHNLQIEMAEHLYRPAIRTPPLMSEIQRDPALPYLNDLRQNNGRNLE